MKYLRLIKYGKHRFELVKKVSTKWRELGLLVELESNTLDEYWSQSQSSASLCWERVMQVWLDGQGEEDYPVTWEGLCRMLRDIRCPHVADELMEAVDKASLAS